MTKAAALLKRLIAWEYFPLLAALLVLLPLHAFARMNVGDDLYFSQALNGLSLPDYLLLRWNGWTSRVIIEVVCVAFAYHPLLFRLVDPFFFLLLIYSMYHLLPGKRQRSSLWVLAGMVFLLLAFSRQAFSGTGWVTTNVYYLWVVAAGLYALILPKRILSGEKTALHQVLLTLPALIYSANHELMAVALFALYGLALAAAWFRRRPWRLLLGGNLIIWAETALIVAAPGNYARYASEVSSWFPSFGSLNLLQKVQVGFSSTMFQLVLKPNVVFLLFAALLLALAVRRKVRPFRLAAAGLPFLATALFGVAGSLFPSSPFGLLRTLTDVNGITITPAYFDVWQAPLLYLAVIVSIALALPAVLKEKRLTWPLLGGLALGLGIRMMMGTSPTVWASGERTFLLLYGALMIASAVLAREGFGREHVVE